MKWQNVAQLIAVGLFVLLPHACKKQDVNTVPQKGANVIEQTLTPQMPLYPINQFDELMYSPRQSNEVSEFESILQDIRNANFESLSRYRSDDPLRKLSRPVGLLKIAINKDQYTTCTASVIDSDKVLTSEHCLSLYSNQVERIVLWMGFYSAEDDYGIFSYNVSVTPLEFSKELDYAILSVDGDVSDWGRVNLSDEVPLERRSLTIVHHPEGIPKQVTQRGCRVGDPVMYKGRLSHLCDTMGGSSGAPIFTVDSRGPRMVALHQAGIPKSLEDGDLTYEFNRAVPMNVILAQSAILSTIVDGHEASPFISGSSTTLCSLNEMMGRWLCHGRQCSSAEDISRLVQSSDRSYIWIDGRNRASSIAISGEKITIGPNFIGTISPDCRRIDFPKGQYVSKID